MADFKRSNLPTRPGLSEEEVEDLFEAFQLFDADGGGTINKEELTEALESLGYKNKNRMVLQMLEVIDQSEEGEVDFDGFLDLMVARIDGRESQEEIVRIFELFDSNDRGYITVDDLARVVKELGENFTRKELDEMIERADLDQDGAINRQEFVNLMLKRVAD